MRSFALTTLLVASCLPTKISGSPNPTDDTAPLSAEDIAAGKDTSCYQDWLTGDAGRDIAMAYALLDERGVRIVRGNPAAGATALRTRLIVADDFDERDPRLLAALLSHELVHYCQRDAQGNDPFDQAYFASPGRWRTEVPAYSQYFRALALYCLNADDLEAAIENRVTSMRQRYWLWDLDPEQYERETAAIWHAAVVDVVPMCPG